MTPPIEIEPSDTPATSFAARWQQRAEELEFETLPALRATADKWAATVGSLTGVLAITALVKGPSDITKVEGTVHALGVSLSWRAVIGVLLASAVALATAAIVCAALAAQGSPEEFRFSGAELRRRYLKASQTAAKQLSWSRRLAITAVPLLAVASGIVWFATPVSDPDNMVLVSRTNGAIVCGTLRASTDGLHVDTGDSDVVIAFAETASVIPTKSCPRSVDEAEKP